MAGRSWMVAWAQHLAHAMTTSDTTLTERGERWPQRLRRRAVAGAAVALLLVLWLNLFAALFGALSGYVLTGLARRPTAQPVSIPRSPATAPLPALAIERWRQLAHAFRDVLAAQLRIALVNAGLTAIYLLAILPAFGASVPLAKTLVAFTFFASLVPIVGNLMSNTAIVVAALTVSLATGAASLVFLVAIHKLEYFLNAHFVGSR